MRCTIGRIGWAVLTTLACGVVALGQGADSPEEVRWPGMDRAGKVLLPNGWSLKPAGSQTDLGDFPVAIAVHPTEPILAVLHAGYGQHEVMTLDAQGQTIARVVIPRTFTGMVWSADGKRLFVSGGFDDVIYRFDHAGGLLSNQQVIAYPIAHRPQPTEPRGDEPLPRAERGSERPQGCVAGLALTGDARSLWVANAFAHSVDRFDLEGNRLAQEIATGDDSYPYALVLDETTHRLYASLWGRAEVAVINTETGEIVARWPTQEHPNEMLPARGGKVLYVANANRNTVTVLDTEKGRAVETIGTAIAPEAPAGSTPNALALSPDENILLVANANTNDVALVNVEEVGHSSPLGFLPVGWYPTSVRVSRDGQTIWVANGKGSTSRANRAGPIPSVAGGGRTREYIAGLFLGTLSTIPLPGPKAMADFSKTVYECSPIDRKHPTALVGSPPLAGNPIPARLGDPSPITHCVYIIKENRTYDQVFGDLPEGNGEPALCLFPEEITPNHHALAQEYVLLDNFYVESEVSADGHEWTMGAYATDFVERTWPLSYRGDKRVPYPAEGKFVIARPAGGYLWDRAAEKEITYRSYGEFISNGKTPSDPSTTTVAALQGHFDPQFRGYDLDYSDQKRADRFLAELARFEREGELPRLIVMRLPNDHTYGTTAGKPTPFAFLADNDLALGRVVEGLSQSRFWPHLAIFVVEDDAQNGPDHVDAHRTVALVISPYIKRHSVDSTLYSTSSMLRTIELCLGLEPMSQFDASARPMWASFTPDPDPTPYEHRPARVDLDSRNPLTAWGSRVSESLDFTAEDRADDLILNEVLWKAVKGPDSPIPPPVRSAFVLPRRVGEDSDEEDD